MSHIIKNKSKINLYSFYKTNNNIFYNSEYLDSNVLNNIKEIKLLLDIYGGHILHSKTHISLYLKYLINNIYLDFISKDQLFILNMQSIIISRVMFVLPLDRYELKCFNEIYELRKTNKIDIFSVGIAEIDKFILKDFIKKLKVKLVSYKTVHFDSLDCIESLMFKIRPDIANLVGNNVFCHNLCNKKINI